ncbi:MAG: ABC transporter ATP-binding protein [Proteobacteria bacterium]|nr:ABC transporter ATP-binding protein [Pseudomonadota bacterium]
MADRPGISLSLRVLTKRYGRQTVVDAVELDVAAGEFLTLLGPSGSGKSSILMMVAGFTPPSSGDVVLGGRSVASLAPEKRNIGVVFQNYALFPHMTVAENVGFPLKMRRLPRAERDARVTETLARVGLAGFDGRLPAQLSGGQQQRVALARALVFAPGLLLMDEPLGALDRNLRERMKHEIRRIHAEFGVTVVYVTHDQEEALTMSDRIALLDRGRIAQLGTAREIYERPKTRFVAEFVGESSLIPGTLVEDGGRWWLDGSAGRLPVPREAAAFAGRSALLMLRPEKLRLVAAESRSGVPGTVIEAVFVGEALRTVVRIEGAAIVVKTATRAGEFRPIVGAPVRVDWDPADLAVLPGEERATADLA